VDERQLQPSPYEVGVAEYYARIRQAVKRETETPQDGGNRWLQSELAALYFGLYMGDGARRRRLQLLQAVGEESTRIVEDGFVRSIDREHIPSLSEIARENAADKIYMYWYAVVAGMDLRWPSRQLDGLSNPALDALVALSLIINTFDDNGAPQEGRDREWARHILETKPSSAERAYGELLTERLHRNQNATNLLYRLPDPKSAPWRTQLAVALIADDDIQDTNNLKELCSVAAETDSGRRQLADLAVVRLLGQDGGGAGRLVWIAVGFLLGLDGFGDRLASAAKQTPELLWIIRFLTKSSDTISQLKGRFTLNRDQIEFVIRHFGRIFQNADGHPSGWVDESPGDAANYIGSLIAEISTEPDSSASSCLLRLMECQELASYRPFISSRLFAQRELNRMARYEKPTWNAVCSALSGGRPANIEDLKALVLDHLAGARQQIKQSNSDMYRIYWNGATPPRPRDENYCRDRLIEYLRERFQPVGAWVEPEGDMAADKSADVVVLGQGSLKLPMEVKRDYHVDLWDAAKNQLGRLYTRDPSARGYGIYLVFYFGPGRGRAMTPHPNGTVVADSQEELERAARVNTFETLRSIIY
jgi:hypothetical protein